MTAHAGRSRVKIAMLGSNIDGSSVCPAGSKIKHMNDRAADMSLPVRKTKSSRMATASYATVSEKPRPSPAMISTVSSRSERMVIRGVKVGKVISSNLADS
jgi:hypothetical protein